MSALSTSRMALSFSYSRVGGRNPRRARLESLAEALRREPLDATPTLSDLFHERATYGEIACLALGGRGGVLDRLRQRGSDAERRQARRLINAWNAVTVGGRAEAERRDAAAWPSPAKSGATARAARRRRPARAAAAAAVASDDDDDDDDAPAARKRRRRVVAIEEDELEAVERLAREETRRPVDDVYAAPAAFAAGEPSPFDAGTEDDEPEAEWNSDFEG